MRHRHGVMALLCFLAVILYLDRICISVALPRIQQELEIPPERLGWVSFAFSLAYAAFEIPGGRMGDRLGPRGVLTRIVTWWSVFTALTGAATGLWSLLVTRFLFGAGEAGAWPNASSAVSRWFPVHARAKAMGLFGAATQIGGGLSPLIVIPIQQRYGWRASFYCFALLGVAWSIVWYAWYRNFPSEKRGVSEAEIAELGDVPPRAPHGLPLSVALRSRSMRGLIAMFFAAVYTGYFAVFWMPTYLVKARGFTELELRWVAVAWIGGIVGNALGGVVSDALVKRLGLAMGRRVAGASGLAIAALGFAMAALASGKVETLAWLTTSFIAWGLIQATSFATCIDIGRSHAGTVSGVMNTAGQIGGALSGIAFGYIVKATGSYDVPLFVMAAVAMLGAAAWSAIDASRPIVVEPSDAADARSRPPRVAA